MAFFLMAATLAAQVAPAPPQDPLTHELAGHVESARLRRTVERLASFGTRHTLSNPSSDIRGIGAARRWLKDETEVLARLPGSRLIPFEDRFTAEPGPRVPKPTEMKGRFGLIRSRPALRRAPRSVFALFS